MKKIMFNDKYGLTEAVLKGRKTMTRRIIPPIAIDWNRRGKVTLPVSCFKGETLFMDASAILDRDFEYPAPAKYQPKFKVGEVVAVAQSYMDAGYDRDMIQRATFRTNAYGGKQIGDFEICLLPGWKNKMYVLPSMMPHQIRITNVRVERLQDISDGDCVREGVVGFTCNLYEYRGICYSFPGDKNKMGTYLTPREAFAALIDKISGKGTWESNPWVFVYEFENVR